MDPTLLKLLPMLRCSHEFSWPRRKEDGHDYQVCLRCGAEYEYDWKTMRRTKMVQAQDSGAAELDKHTKKEKKKWQPRARRLGVESEIQVRERATTEWRLGKVQNISRSGVRFHMPQGLAAGTAIEFILEMPAEISGQPHSKVICNGSVVRTIVPANLETGFTIAAGITDYQFLHEAPNEIIRITECDIPEDPSVVQKHTPAPAMPRKSKFRITRSRHSQR